MASRIDIDFKQSTNLALYFFRIKRSARNMPYKSGTQFLPDRFDLTAIISLFFGRFIFYPHLVVISILDFKKKKLEYFDAIVSLSCDKW